MVPTGSLEYFVTRQVRNIVLADRDTNSGNSDFDAQHDDVRDTPPPASRILFRPIATSRQWLASEMEVAPLAMEADNLEMTVFLTRHSHLSPHVSQRFQRSLPDLGRSLSQESTSSLA
jgi:hypothetical protein